MYDGTLITEIMAIVEARLKADPPTEEDWKRFLDDGLPSGKEITK